MDDNKRVLQLYRIYDPYVSIKIVRDENGKPTAVPVFSEDATQEVIDAFYEAQEIMSSPDYEPIR